MRSSLLSPRGALNLDLESREPPARGADGLSLLDDQLEATLDKVFRSCHDAAELAADQKLISDSGASICAVNRAVERDEISLVE